MSNLGYRILNFFSFKTNTKNIKIISNCNKNQIESIWKNENEEEDLTNKLDNIKKMNLIINKELDKQLKYLDDIEEKTENINSNVKSLNKKINSL